MTQFFSTPEQGEKLKQLGIETEYSWRKDKNGWHLHDFPATDDKDLPAMSAEEGLRLLGDEFEAWYHNHSGGYQCSNSTLEFYTAYAQTLAEAVCEMVLQVKTN